MNEIGQEREVDFHAYCKTCKHVKKKENEEPCYDCLATPVQANSRKPARYEEQN